MANIDNTDKVINALLKPVKLWSRVEVLAKPCPIPREPGIYAWYFKEIPPRVPIEDSVNWKGLTFLYLGISPRTSLSQGNIRKRIQYHYRGNAYGSTLRLSLGCLLSKKLGIQLKKYGGGKRKHFGEEEGILSQWMAENAYVTWVVFQKPWAIEEILISQISLPLNLLGNKQHPFYVILSEKRKECKKAAIEAE